MSGENPKFRESMDKMTGHLVKHGMDPKKAQEKARASARRMHERLDGKVPVSKKSKPDHSR